MNTSRSDQIRAYMRLPWTVTTEPSEHGEYLVARVMEIPDAIATGVDNAALAKDLWASLWSSISSRLEHGDEIPRPENRKTPPTAAPVVIPVAVGRGEAWEASFAGGGGLLQRAL